MNLEIWPILTWPWPDLDYKVLKIASHDPMDIYFEFPGRGRPGNMCRMTYLWLENSHDIFWPSFDLQVH